MRWNTWWRLASPGFPWPLLVRLRREESCTAQHCPDEARDHPEISNMFKDTTVRCFNKWYDIPRIWRCRQMLSLPRWALTALHYAKSNWIERDVETCACPWYRPIRNCAWKDKTQLTHEISNILFIKYLCFQLLPLVPLLSILLTSPPFLISSTSSISAPSSSSSSRTSSSLSIWQLRVRLHYMTKPCNVNQYYRRRLWMTLLWCLKLSWWPPCPPALAPVWTES